MANLKSRALRRFEVHFAAPVPGEAFADLLGLKDVAVHDTVLQCAVMGSVDALVKAAARFEVLNIVTHEPSLEEVFLTYYGERGDHAA